MFKNAMNLIFSRLRPGLGLMTALALGVSATAASAQGTPPDAGTVKLGWVKSTANLLAVAAPQFSGKHGLKIESINFNNAQDILTALISGQLDIGLLTPVHLLRAIDTNVDVVQISGNTRGNTGIVAAKKLGLKENDWDGLKALIKTKKPKVASSRGSINEMLALASFAKHGIDANKDLDIVNIANFAQHPQALRSGEFDMIITLEPLVSLVIADGTGTLFTHPYDTAAEDLNTNYVIRKALLQSNPEKARAFVATLADSAKFLADKDHEMATAIKLTGLKPDVLKLALANSHYELRNRLPQMQALAKLAAELHVTTRDVSADLPKFVDDRFLKEAGVAP